MALWQLTVFISFLGGFLWGYDASSMSGSILFIRNQLHIGSTKSEDLISATTWAYLISTIFVTWMVNRFGRKKILLLSVLLLTIGPAYSYLAQTFALLDLSRWITGFGMGLNGVVITLYIMEMAPIKSRGKLLILNSL
ncbi:MAG: MFS transporter, partial [bacterium]|nr:MFS transporter [bacterium]